MLGRWRSSKVLAPTSVLANRSTMYRFIPCTTDTTATRNITPMRTPTSEKKLLSFCVRIIPTATPPASSSRTLCRGAPREPVALHLPVAQHDDALRVRGDVGLVGHHDHGLARRVQVG